MYIFFLFCFTADSTAINLKLVGVIVTDHGGLLLNFDVIGNAALQLLLQTKPLLCTPSEEIQPDQRGSSSGWQAGAAS